MKSVDILILAVAVFAIVTATSCNGADSVPPTSPSPLGSTDTPPPIMADVIFTGAGDIAPCSPAPERTARLLDSIAGTVFTLGDNTYPSGNSETFARCYEPTWGRHRDRTRPTPGNHDWGSLLGMPYFAYFGVAAGPAGVGYYSFDLGAWHILSLNSNISADPGSPQYEWARQDLEGRTGLCSLAYWHHPVFSSAMYGNLPRMREMWRLLDAAGIDLVLAGHEHSYERFAPQTADGHADASGVREIVAGTGGASLRGFRAIQPNSEVRNSSTFGVLKLTLRSSSYDWEFVPVDGYRFTDAGTAECVQ